MPASDDRDGQPSSRQSAAFVLRTLANSSFMLVACELHESLRKGVFSFRARMFFRDRLSRALARPTSRAAARPNPGKVADRDRVPAQQRGACAGLTVPRLVPSATRTLLRRTVSTYRPYAPPMTTTSPPELDSGIFWRSAPLIEPSGRRVGSSHWDEFVSRNNEKTKNE